MTHTCAQCGTLLPDGTPEGLCPACLLKRGFATVGGLADFTPPSPEELAEYFPQLEIHELLGRGGMGAVYKARQRELDRMVALKILPSGADRDPAFAERFSREARALARLAHPNIVAVYDFGQAGGLFYFVMEYVDGLNLRQLLTTAQMTPQEALAIVPQICEALQTAHDQGIVHRDIKPENILLDKKGRVKIADFGIAKIMGGDGRDMMLTGVGEMVGTPAYMAPEQIEHPAQVDHRADIYSLGVVFYQMLTGELPLGKFASPSRIVRIDVRLDDVVLRALEKEPQLRYQQASEVKTQVETISTTKPKPQARSPRKIVLAIVVTLGILVCATILFIIFAFFALRKAPVVEPSKVTGDQPEQTIVQYEWPPLSAPHDGSLHESLENVDGRQVLKISNESPFTELLLLRIDKPPITAMRYAFTGEIKYSGVRAMGFLESWNYFPPANPGSGEPAAGDGERFFFSRTLGESGSGPMAKIQFDSDWRTYSLPFDRTRIAVPPSRLELRLHLVGSGTIWITPPRLVQYVDSPATPSAPPTGDALMKRGADFVELLTSGKFTEASKWFDTTMSAAVSDTVLASEWHQLDIGGKYLGHDSPHMDQEGQYTCVYVPCRWERNKVDIKVVFDSAGKVSGMWVVPYG